MCLRDVAGLREQQGDGVLRRGHDVRLRRVDHQHAAASAGLHVDVVESDAGTRHDLQRLGGVDHLGVDPRLRTDDQCIVRCDLAGQSVLCELTADVHLEVLAQQLEAPV